MNRIFFVLFCLLSFVSSCNYSSESREINAENKFTLSVPGFLEETDELKPGAPIQVRNKFRNLYVVAFPDPQPAAGDQEFYENGIRVLKSALKNPQVSDTVHLQISGHPCIQTALFGKMQGENIFYLHLAVMGGKQRYEVCTWTRSEERWLRFRPDMEKILTSFREL
jgi:hypothetical protein